MKIYLLVKNIYNKKSSKDFSRKKKKKAPSFEVPHLCSSLGTSPQRSSEGVSLPPPETKKYLDFQ